MPSFQVNRLLDFADVTGDWLPIIHSIGPDGDLSILLTDQPNQHERRWDWNREAMPQELAPWGEQFRLIHLPDGVLNSRVRFIDLPPGKRPLHSVLALGLDRWLVIPALLNNYDVPLPYELALSQVIDSCSVVLTELPVGYPWFAEATSDNQIWLGYVGSEDKHFSRYARLEDADLRSLDANGTVLFSLREASMPSQMLPSVDFIYGINIVSEHEVWVAYQSIERYSFEGYAGWLVRIVDRAVVSVWPWSIVSEKAPLLFPKPFAVADGRLLLKGLGDPDETWGPPRCSPHRDDDRLYSVSLTTQRSLEVLPVDERGEWIGPFRTEGRGSRLYLETEHSLYVIDAATLPIQ